MPRFYFDIREGMRFFPDTVGSEFDILDAAEREAATVAAEIGRDRLPTGDARQVTVELKNEHHQRLLTVTVSMEIHRVKPVPRRGKADDYYDRARSAREVARWVSGEDDKAQLLRKAEQWEALADAEGRKIGYQTSSHPRPDSE